MCNDKINLKDNFSEIPVKKETIGEILKNKRQSLNLSLDDIVEVLRIKKSYLEALENDNFMLLPGNAYAIGFLKSYSSYLNLNVSEIIDLYKQVMSQNDVSVEFFNSVDDKPLVKDSLINTNYVIIFVLVCILGGIISYLVKNTNDSSVELNIKQSTIAEDNLEISLPSALNRSTNIENQNQQQDDNINSSSSNLSSSSNIGETKIDQIELFNNTQSNLVKEDKQQINDKDSVVGNKQNEYGLEHKYTSRIKLKITKRNWIKLKKDGLYKYDEKLGDIGTGQTVFEKVLNPGDIYYIPNGVGYFLTIGNAQGVDIVVDNKIIEPLSKYEVSRLNIEMDVDKLLNGIAYKKSY